MKLVIVGGVAGGASAAARARRLSESAEIIVFERGSAVSFANCGLPYYIGGKIKDRNKLLVTRKEVLETRLRLDIRTRTEVVSIDPGKKMVRYRNIDTGLEGEESYDKLILSPGAHPIRPNQPGYNLENVFTIRDLDDADVLHSKVTGKARKAAIIGGGFIGIELAENLRRRGFYVALIELGGQVLSIADPEMVTPLHQSLGEHGVDLYLNNSAESIKKEDDGLQVHLTSGETLQVDFVVVSIGVKPENRLAKEAGLEIGPRGGIVVDEFMQTSNPDVYAVGDAVETSDFVTGQRTQVPLGGPANRQGRIAADHVFGRSSRFRGTQGTAIVGFFENTVGITGLTEKLAKLRGVNYEKIYLHAPHHAGYFPGAEQMMLKLLFDPSDGRVLGAQAAGGQGVDKRIDVISVAIQGGMSVFDLEEMELAYAPQFGAAKDPVNMAGFIAAGVLRGDQPILHVEKLANDSASEILLLDVRTPSEFSAGHIPKAQNVPLEQLRKHLGELPRDKMIVPYCRVGQRGYLATRILAQSGFSVQNLSGGYLAWKAFHPSD